MIMMMDTKEILCVGGRGDDIEQHENTTWEKRKKQGGERRRRRRGTIFGCFLFFSLWGGLGVCGGGEGGR